MKTKLVTPTKKDFAPWLEMRHLLWTYHMKFALRSEMKDIYRKYEAGERMVFLAKQVDVYCGFIELSLHEKAPGCETSPLGFTEGWFVREEARKQGVGRMLVAAGEEWARTKGCTEMAADTNRLFPVSPSAHVALGYEVAEKENDHYYFRKQL